MTIGLPPLSTASFMLEGQQMFHILSKCIEIESKGEKVYHFELGDPDFDTPNEIVQSAITSLLSGRTHYEASSGNQQLLHRAREVTLTSRNFMPSADQLLVTPGANYQIFLALACTCNPGDEVLIPDPGFVSYKSICKFLNLVPVYYTLKESNSFETRLSDIVPMISSSTRAIIINSPSNPTGAVSSQSEISKLFEFCRVNNKWLISDEIYARLTYSDSKPHFSPSCIDHCQERVVLINGFSKAYAMTGWRVGVVTAPTFLIDKMRLLLETSLSCVPPFIQDAACSALSINPNHWLDMVNTYENRRNLLVSGLSALKNFRVCQPEGAFYVFANISESGYDDIEFSRILLEECRIAVTPGRFFGPSGKNHIRFSFCCSTSDIMHALDLLHAKFG